MGGVHYELRCENETALVICQRLSLVQRELALAKGWNIIDLPNRIILFHPKNKGDKELWKELPFLNLRHPSTESAT